MLECCGKEFATEHGYVSHRGIKHQTPVEEVKERYPSTKFGEKEWYLILTIRGDIFDSLLRDIGVGGCSGRARKPLHVPAQRGSMEA